MIVTARRVSYKYEIDTRSICHPSHDHKNEIFLLTFTTNEILDNNQLQIIKYQLALPNIQE